MTNETKELFDAPWRVEEHKEDAYFSVIDADGRPFSADIPYREDANRLARLPELYDALVHFVHRSCSSANIDRCPNQGAGWIGCKDCTLMPYIELLRKVRDGE